MEKEICKDILNRSKEIGLQYILIFLEMEVFQSANFFRHLCLVIVNVY